MTEQVRNEHTHTHSIYVFYSKGSTVLLLKINNKQMNHIKPQNVLKVSGVKKQKPTRMLKTKACEDRCFIC